MTQLIKENLTSPSPLVGEGTRTPPPPFRGRVGVGVTACSEFADNPHPNLPPKRGKESSRTFYQHQPRDQKLKKHSRQLRKNMTDVERKLWRHLRHEQLGVKFRRQYPIGSYIVDFVCLDKHLIVELDGGQHAEQVEYDQERDQFFMAQGFKILRFWNNEVMGNMEGVLQTILSELTPLPNPSPTRGEGL